MQNIPTRILGIDPGLSGALSLIQGDNLLKTMDMPVFEFRTKVKKKLRRETNILLLVHTILNMEPDLIIVEKVFGSSKMGGAGGFNFGANFGCIMGVITALDIPFELVKPRQWKGWYGLTAIKSESRDLAKEYFPESSESFKLVKHTDNAEAALMARYGQEFIL